MQGPNFDKVAKNFGDINSSRWKTKGKYIGDIEDYKLLQDGIYYSLWDNDMLIAFCSLSTSDISVYHVLVFEEVICPWNMNPTGTTPSNYIK